MPHIHVLVRGNAPLTIGMRRGGSPEGGPRQATFFSHKALNVFGFCSTVS
jgi:hypothetical protein